MRVKMLISIEIYRTYDFLGGRSGPFPTSGYPTSDSGHALIFSV